jgi:membrane-bound lytic murein transglycosylase D
VKRARLLLVACAGLALAACATAPRPPVAAPEEAVAAAPPVAVPGAPPPDPAPVKPPPEPAEAPAAREPAAGWPALAASFEFARCDDAAAAVRRWTRVYTANPKRFEDMLRRALPFLGYVQGEVLAAKLPGEFVLLPLVESSYVAFASKGNRPAGIWQFMPVTARHFGLAVGPAYDARLDVAAATRAAVEYLTYLGGRFERDWTLVNMAFNAGEYRVRGALARARRGGAPLAHDQLALSPITHEHFAKLTALACIVREPERWHVRLPERDSQPLLAALPLAAATDVALLARVARSDVASLERFNPAARGGRLPAGAMALVPASEAAAAATRLERVPRELRTGWRMADTRSRDWNALAGSGVDAALLAELNDAAPDAAPPPRVLARSRSAAAGGVAAAADAAGRYAVRAGDSLWLIARRFGVSVASLLQWNALPTRHVLRPGQLLWVAAPR